MYKHSFLLLLFLGIFCWSCDSEPEVTFQIGDVGPAGGIVFYDKGNDAIGWQFIEVAPTDLPGAEWGCHDAPIVAARQSGIGLGLLNSESIVSFHDNLDDFYNNPDVCSEISDGTVAAKTCLDFVSGEFGDWHLPSLEEAELLYENLHLQGFGNFDTTKLYWTSTEQDENLAPAIDFSSGAKEGLCKQCHEGNRTLIRPVRYF